jgi:maleylacetoacetate isomerase
MRRVGGGINRCNGESQSMPTLTLYDYWRSSAAYRVRIALHLKGLSFAQVPVNLVKGEQQAIEHKARNPQGFVPALALGDGSLLTQSLAIIDYLDTLQPAPPLWPADPVAKARAQAMALLIACDIHPVNNLRILNYLKNPLGADAAGTETWYRHWIAEGFAALEQLAAPGPYLAGEQLSVADICLVPQMANARRFKTDLTPYPRLVAVDARLSALPAFAAAAPEGQPDAPPTP